MATAKPEKKCRVCVPLPHHSVGILRITAGQYAPHSRDVHTIHPSIHPHLYTHSIVYSIHGVEGGGRLPSRAPARTPQTATKRSELNKHISPWQISFSSSSVQFSSVRFIFAPLVRHAECATLSSSFFLALATTHTHTHTERCPSACTSVSAPFP